MKKTLLYLLLFAPLGSFAQDIYVVFNEINCDNPGGPDTQEFLELYGTPEASLDSLVLVFFDGTAGTSYSAIDLDGRVLDSNGFFVIGNANTVNVDLVIGNSSFQNGQDGVALYHADASDFPNGSQPTSVYLLEAAVYGTGDATATNLIVGLGLDVTIPGYTQLDETAQQTGNDLSLSRLPDGGNPFEFAPFTLQEATPGTWNQPLCFAGYFLTSQLADAIEICNTEISYVEHFVFDIASYGDSSGIVVTDIDGLIVTLTDADSLELAVYPVGTYFIYSFFYNGDLQLATAQIGMPYSGMLAGDCLTFSGNAVTFTSTACDGCIGGTISDPTYNSAVSFCAGIHSSITLTNTSTSLAAEYLYIIADESNLVVDTFSSTYDVSELAVGIYTIQGLSYTGDIDPLLISPGSDITQIVASICQEFSENDFALTLYNCAVNTPCSTLFISEYLEGNNGTKALELFNPTLSAIDLSGYSLLNYSNGAITPTNTFALAGSIPPLGTWVVANPGTGNGNGQADPQVLALADVTNTVANFSGNDYIELRLDDVVIDAIGVLGIDPGNQSGWPVGSGTTRNADLVRQSFVQTPTDIWDVSAFQWDVFDNTDYSHLGAHTFNTCSTDALIGFAGSNFSIEENAGTISILITGVNITNPIAIDVSISGGSASAADFILSGAATFIFDGTNNLQSFLIDIVDDLELETDETIELTLSSPDDFIWLTQTIEITILANDPNCDGGSISQLNGQGPIDQCADLPNTPIDVIMNTTMPLASYVYVITNSVNTIIEIVNSSPIDMDANGVGTYRIWGLSYTGTLDPNSILPGVSALNILSDSCATLSSNFITVVRSACTLTGCDAGEVALNDGTASISLCVEDATMLTPINTGGSVDDIYVYFLTDDADLIVQEFSTELNPSLLPIGNYRIYGISHQGAFIQSTVGAGLPLDGVLSNGCESLSSNFIEVHIYDCTLTPSCTYAYFSEYLEEAQSNKAFEIYNPTNGDIDLSDYVVNMYFNGDPNPTYVLQCEGILASHDVFVVVSSGNGVSPTSPEILAVADTLHEVATFSGNDALELVFQGTPIDIIGVIGEDSGNQGWLFGNTGTANHDLVRRPEVNAPNYDWSVVSGQWLSYAPTDYSHLGYHDANACESPLIQEAGFTITATTVSENAGLIQVEVQANNIINPVSIAINAAGSATNGEDYNAAWPVILNFGAGNSVQTFDVSILTDALLESDETIVMSLTGNISNWLNTESTITIENVLGIAEINSRSLHVYPNPANDLLTIQSVHFAADWIIRDMSGRMVMSGSSLGKRTFSIDTNLLHGGQYSIELVTANKIEVARFVVVH